MAREKKPSKKPTTIRHKDKQELSLNDKLSVARAKTFKADPILIEKYLLAVETERNRKGLLLTACLF